MARLLRFLLVVSGFSACLAHSAEPDSVYELRIYTTNEGKLPALLQRFREHTCQLFEKHGIVNIGYWTPVDKADGADTTLIYLLKHASRDAAKASFEAFGKDPAWQAARSTSEAGGKLLAKAPESIFLNVTDFSPPINLDNTGMERAFELRIYKTPPGKLPSLHERFRDHTIGLFSKYGMTHIGYWTPTDEEKGRADTLIYLLAHRSHEAGLQSFTTFRADPQWIQAKAASEKDGALTLPQPDGVKSIYLVPTDFSTLR